MSDRPGEWLVEEGIAEHRAIRIEAGVILEARLHWPGRLAAGWVVPAKLVSRTAGASRGTAKARNGEEILVDRLPNHVSEGAELTVRVSRAAIDTPGRFKRAQGRTCSASTATPTLAELLRAEGAEVVVARRFPVAGWDELVSDALQGQIDFSGGSLLLAATPAMTTVDIDGSLPPRALALAAVTALGSTLRRLDIGGSVVVDFLTLPARPDRQVVDAALEQALSEWPHERTAMNGFGLVQLIARLERPSLLQLATWRRAGLVWRNLLRRAEVLEGSGGIELTLHPRLEREAAPDHVAELERRSGKRVRIRKAESLALEAPHAQLVSND